MSPDFGKELTLPELTAGKKYTIKTWYISKDDKESESVITELIAWLWLNLIVKDKSICSINFVDTIQLITNLERN